MLAILSKIYDKQISSKGLSVFRIFFSLNLFFEVFHKFKFRHLYYELSPYIEQSVLSNKIIWFVWFGLVLMLFLGVKTRIAAVFNYIFILSFIVNNSAFEYHMDYTYTGVSFLMVFLPISKSYSIDNLILRIKYSSRNKLFIPKELTSKFYYLITIIIGIGFVYFDSIFFKFKSKAWLSGLGLWLPASLPPFTISDNQWILNQEYFIKGVGYFTLMFELCFLFIFWVKKLRVSLFLIGLVLHLGILFVFPIPYFALGVSAVYLVLIPVSFWNYLEEVIEYKTKKITFYYDDECPLCLRTKIIITFFDVFKAVSFKEVQAIGSSVKELQIFSETELLDNIYSVDKKGKVRSGVDTYFKVFQYIPFLAIFLLFRLPGLYQISKYIYGYVAKNRTVERCSYDNCVVPGSVNSYIDDNEFKIFKNLKVYDLKKKIIIGVFLFLTILQLNSSFNFPCSGSVMRRLDSKSVFYKGLNRLKKTKKTFRSFSRFFFGITKHGVFIDSHYIGYDEVYTLKYEDKLLPLFNSFGQPDRYITGGLWANFGFRVNRPFINLNSKELIKGLIRYSQFYSKEKGLSLHNVNFEILRKELKSSFNWQKNLLQDNLKAPWVEVGRIKFENSKAEVILKSEE